MSLFNELKRRNVFRVGIAYVVAAWLLLQGIDFGLDVISAPNWIIQVITLLAAVGLPVTLVLAWVFEMTPEGIKRESEIQRDTSVTVHTAKKLDKLTIALLIAVVVIVIADRFVPKTENTTPPVASEAVTQVDVTKPEPVAESIPSLAVLPFTNMSSDPDNEYFSDGISEELLNLLVQVDGLRVPSRTSSFAFKGMNMDIKEIAKKLSVDHILEGSVRKAGNQVRITAQLIDVSTDTHLWSNSYDRELENIFAIQDEISQEIIRELKIALGTSGLLSREASRPTNDMEAYQEYLRGRHLFLLRGVQSLKASMTVLQSAVSRDPGFAEAWAALSQTAAILSGWDPENQQIYDEVSFSAGNRALQLDANSAIAMSAMGMLNYNKGNWAESITLLEQAAGLTKDSNPVYFYGLVLQSTGYLAEARKMLEKAERMDPVYAQLQSYLGGNAMLREDHQTARIHFMRTIEGNNSNGAFNMVWLELRLGNQQAAVRYLKDLITLIRAGNTEIGSEQALMTIINALEDPSLVDEGIEAAIGNDEILWASYLGADTEIMDALNGMLAEKRMIRIAILLGGSLWASEFHDLRQTPEYRQFLTDTGLVDVWKSRGWPDLCHPTGEDDFECN